MKENCTIRAFETADLPRLHEIRNAAFKPVFKSFRDLLGVKIAPVALATAEKEQGDYLGTICEKDSSHDVFVVEHDDVIIGFCAVSINSETKIGEIDLNAVDPDFQSNGIGAMMFDHALALMRKAGMKVATVGTGGDASHAPARRAYEKAGFNAAIPNVYLYRQL